MSNRTIHGVRPKNPSRDAACKVTTRIECYYSRDDDIFVVNWFKKTVKYVSDDIFYFSISTRYLKIIFPVNKQFFK